MNWSKPIMKLFFYLTVKKFGSGGRTLTYDLRVMSPTSYQLLHPAIVMVGGIGFEPMKAKPADLQSAPFNHSGIRPYGAGNRT